MKNQLPDVLAFSSFSFHVLNASEAANNLSLTHSENSQANYAVFAVPHDSVFFVQISKWYKYRGAAINRMFKLAKVSKH